MSERFVLISTLHAKVFWGEVVWLATCVRLLDPEPESPGHSQKPHCFFIDGQHDATCIADDAVLSSRRMNP